MNCATLQFPWKLHVLLAHAESKGWTDIVSWMPEGTAFKVHDKRRFEKHIMPKYFKTTTYKSFQRSCNIWGFETKTRGFETGFLFHPYFQKGKSDLCNRMVRGGKDSQIVLGETTEALASTTSISSSPPPTSQENVATIDAKRTQNTPSLSFEKLECNSVPIISPSPVIMPEDTSNVSKHLALLIILQQQEQQMQRDQEDAERKRKEAQRQMEQEVLSAALNRVLVQQIRECAPNRSSVLQASSLAGMIPFSIQDRKQGELPLVGYAQERRLSLNDRTRKVPSPPPPLLESQVRRYAAAQEGRTTLVPCRARGVPLTHNARSAVFEISEDTKHGTELVCTHASCRANGIKFKWCAHCKVPVAKRTFWALHGHGAKKKGAVSPRCQKSLIRKREQAEDAKTQSATAGETGPNLSDLPLKKRRLDERTASKESTSMTDSLNRFFLHQKTAPQCSLSSLLRCEPRDNGSTEANFLRQQEQQRLPPSILAPTLSSQGRPSPLQTGVLPSGMLLLPTGNIRAIDEETEDSPNSELSASSSALSSRVHVIP